MTFTPIYTGKVRDMYDAGDDRLLLVTSDRMSAFDVVASELVEHKGKVLQGISNFWFDYFADVPNHIISTDPADFPPEFQDQPDLEGRAMLVHRAEMLRVECIVRGNITGSGWKDYQNSGKVCGIELPPGLKLSQPLPELLFTPSSKATDGHDVNISFEEAVATVEGQFPGQGVRLMSQAKELSLDLFQQGVDWAVARGITIADTKFEMGLVDGQLVVADEVLTPDSSRFWPTDQVFLGANPPSFDKQPVRDYLDGLDWDKKPPMPPLPEEVLDATTVRYIKAYELITGQEFPYG